MHRKKNISLIYAQKEKHFLNLCTERKTFPFPIYAQKEKNNFLNLCKERNHFQNLCTERNHFLNLCKERNNFLIYPKKEIISFP